MNSRADVRLQLLMFCDWLPFHSLRHFVDRFLEVGDGIWICDLRKLLVNTKGSDSRVGINDMVSFALH